ncbi:hypothetical protein Tdes44962_MAKER06354 [Teratosphaeria destructans]|uniref:Uncharacterized protein n=1 Tax=Teratosphaeria destructans TaxID=418781 RepID=A0A9W7VXY4_9PEZI|nr:hypothetical protein Tdes44962_MAKER06354 [Teratosphaeria destructans]
MNTISLVLNGKTAAEIALMPARQRASLTTLYRPSSLTTPSASPTLSARSSPSKRPQARRQVSRDSPGWYNTDGGMTLDDFAKRLDTYMSRFEQWQSKCAQNAVMALMRPTPIVLFLFNPISMLVWLLVAAVWLSTRFGRSEAGAEG